MTRPTRAGLAYKIPEDAGQPGPRGWYRPTTEYQPAEKGCLPRRSDLRYTQSARASHRGHRLIDPEAQMIANRCPSQLKLKSILDYDQGAGVFRWKENAERSAQWNGRYAGAVAGKVTAGGRRIISIDKRLYRASRLAWVYVHGVDLPDEIDHADVDASNDAITNLRPANSSQNKHNRPGRSLRGLPKGVTLTASGKFGGKISLHGEHFWLGSFDTADQASTAYAEAAEKLYGQHARAT